MSRDLGTDSGGISSAASMSVTTVKRILIGVSLALVVAVVAPLVGAEVLYRYALSDLGTRVRT